MKQILVVDDDSAFSRAVCLSLSDLGTTRSATSASEALDYLNKEPFALVVTDYKLATGPSGLELASTIKRFKSPPSVIMMTAFATTKMAIDSVNTGLFAFVEKPFEADELRKHVVRALEPGGNSRQEFELDPSRNRVAYKGEDYILTKTEYAIVALFIANPNQWLTRQAIEAAIWSETRSGSPNIFDTHLTNLRRKLPFLKDRLEAVRGRGYVFKKRMTGRASFILCWFYALYSSLVLFAEIGIIPPAERAFYIVTKLAIVWMVVPAGFALRKNTSSKWANWLVGLSMMIYPGFCGYWRINYEYAVFELLIAYALAFDVSRRMFTVVAIGSASLFAVTRILRFEYLKPQFTAPSPTDGALVAFAISFVCLIFYVFVQRQRTFRATALTRFGLIGQHASNIIHDVKNLISTPSVHAATLKRKLEFNDDPEVHEILGEMQTSLARTRKLVVDLNEMARLTEAGHISVISVRNLIHEVTDFLHIHMRGVSVEVRGDLEMRGDRALLYSVFMSLFMNSVDQFRKSATDRPLIVVDLEKDRCRISDNGGGFDDDILGSLKDAGWSRTTKAQGSGMGLYLVSSALVELGGRAEFSNTTNGALVELRFAN